MIGEDAVRKILFENPRRYLAREGRLVHRPEER